MSRMRCRTPGCEHHVREGLRDSASFRLADGEYCWRCRRAQNQPGFVDRSFFTVGQHDVPDQPPSAEEIERQLTEAWGPGAMTAKSKFRTALAMSDEEFARTRGL